MSYTGQTQPLPATAARRTRFSAAVIKSAWLVNIARWALWIIAGAALLTSLLGNYVQLNGGWERATVLDDAGQRALFYAFLWQAACSACQFAFLRVRVWAAYLTFLGASVVPSAMSYGALALPAITAWLVGSGWGNGVAGCAALFIVGVGVILMDAMPEWVLVER